ncbi:retrovirus-related pol polyprotein from transposon TNT 1-94 [Tanacetum coccineum]
MSSLKKDFNSDSTGLSSQEFRQQAKTKKPPPRAIQRKNRVPHSLRSVIQIRGCFQRTPCFVRNLDVVDCLQRKPKKQKERLYPPKPVPNSKAESPDNIIRPDINGQNVQKIEILKEYGLIVFGNLSHQASSVRTPQQNGVVERSNRTLRKAPVWKPKNVKEAIPKTKHDEETLHPETRSRLVVKGPDIEHRHYLFMCSWYQANPTENTSRRLKGSFVISGEPLIRVSGNTKDSGFELTGFSDADYAGCKDTFQEILSGGAQFFRRKLVTVPSKKQYCNWRFYRGSQKCVSIRLLVPSPIGF